MKKAYITPNTEEFSVELANKIMEGSAGLSSLSVGIGSGGGTSASSITSADAKLYDYDEYFDIDW